MSLLDDLRNLLARHLAHINSQTQQGTVLWIEDHLNRLDAVVSNDIAAGEAKVHEILGELYAATNAPASPGPAPSTADAPGPAAAPVGVGEPAPEVPDPASTNPTSMGQPAPDAPAAAPGVDDAPDADQDAGDTASAPAETTTTA